MGFEPIRLAAGDFKSPVSAVPPRPHNWRLGVYHDTAEAERVMLRKVEEVFLSLSQPYILSIAQIFEFVKSFLKSFFRTFH